MNLFQVGDFTLASGAHSTWKIECDALTEEDWAGLAEILSFHLPNSFGEVVGVPRGGIPLQKALEPYRTDGAKRVLVVDDVWTTGGSMDRFIEQHAELAYMRDHWSMDRAVVFARNPVPAYVVALFQMPKAVW